MHRKFYEQIGEKIRACRREKKLTQSDLASRLPKNSTATYINLIESGKRRVSLRGIIDIAKALKVPLHYFLDEYIDKMDSEVMLNFALMSDYNLSSSQRDMVISFVDFLHKSNLGSGKK